MLLFTVVALAAVATPPPSQPIQRVELWNRSAGAIVADPLAALPAAFAALASGVDGTEASIDQVDREIRRLAALAQVTQIELVRARQRLLRRLEGVAGIEGSGPAGAEESPVAGEGESPANPGPDAEPHSGRAVDDLTDTVLALEARVAWVHGEIDRLKRRVRSMRGDVVRHGVSISALVGAVRSLRYRGSAGSGDASSPLIGTGRHLSVRLGGLRGDLDGLVTVLAAIDTLLGRQERGADELLNEGLQEGTGLLLPGTVPFVVCPVDPPRSFSDDFGAPRWAGGYHPHAGIDIFAPTGTPIRAPFDGTAEATPNGLGGEAVKVYGELGFVYNAHLSGYGQMGQVDAGDVIGYVGNTGDALGTVPHDHFEWHPGGGPAVNPFQDLLAVC
jgi:murein DD-endopeptidase MepM/ murein hydrolase activator NlpD